MCVQRWVLNAVDVLGRMDGRVDGWVVVTMHGERAADVIGYISIPISILLSPFPPQSHAYAYARHGYGYGYAGG